MPQATRILLLSAYDAVSHQHWRRALYELFPDAHWNTLSLPARHFSWRVRGNSLSWAFNHRQELTDNYELLIATSLTDLSALRGFVPQLASIPTLVYFHENQFAYPDNAKQTEYQPQNLLNMQLTSIYTALCADRIAFNSDWNRRSFLDGARRLLARLPDHVPRGLIDHIEHHSLVLPVPLPDSLFPQQTSVQSSRTRPKRRTDGVINIVWNHRHEYDKGPGLLLAIVQELTNRDFRFRLHLLGQRFRHQPADFKTLRGVLAEYYARQEIEPGIDKHIEDRHQYLHLLSDCDFVLSTAQHDFQGLSVLEACAAGCMPIVPDALAYPEYFPSYCRYAVVSDAQALQARAAADCLQALLSDLDSRHPEVNHLSAAALSIDWRNTFSALIRQSK